ncbi:MAG TPA: Coq4 family protein [Flavobacteriaceae bacterium]|nr:hypothetical protein [Flavobacteriaceae bacterium]HPF11894.1 Coq4 family protein [Flavobacteriaceae bacterium]HQU21171.1 Coq4 family protein [Flavobacteriaceae bacterium]HQU65371.1 Coq4 family protein [Flavobacteriaceae bacterium]HRW45434.1 Coq4 family protein [Flavobacteriaceae bacterium]
MRKQLIAWLFEKTQKGYTRYFKKNKKPWGITKRELLLYPEESFGHHLGLFLQKHGFELIPKVERHDAYHVITGYGTRVEDEIALQYLCFGNGKRSLYLFGVMFLGTMILPDYLPYYLNSFQKGKNCHHFHGYDYSKMLEVPLSDFRHIIFSNNQQLQHDI